MKIENLSVVVALSVLSLSPLPASSAMAKPTVQASGEGLFFESFGGELRVFSFHAHEIDGEVQGNAVLARPGPQANLHVEITCIRVVDSDTLLIGGILQKATEFLPEGSESVFAVRDGGQGGQAQDFLSALHEGTCESEQPLTTLGPIDAGTINVRVDEE